MLAVNTLSNGALLWIDETDTSSEPHKRMGVVSGQTK
jgi:hypothetical protein